jgi:hypothetical protein
MDDMRDRYRAPGRDNPPPRPVHETLRHAYQPPPRPHAPSRRPHNQPEAQRSQPPPAEPEPTQRHIEAAPARRQHYKQPKTRLWPNLVVLVVILAALAGAGVYAYPKFFGPNPFPANIQQNAQLSLLYPTKLPAGYQVDKTSFNLDNGILIYSAANGDKKMVFTLQKTPSNFDFTSFYKQQLSGTQQFQTPYGQATIGKNSGHYLGSLPAGDTWVLLSTNSPAVSIDDMSTALQNLKKY